MYNNKTMEQHIIEYLLTTVFIGIPLSYFHTWFFMTYNKNVVTRRHIYLGIIGPFVWPLQIIKFLLCVWHHPHILKGKK